MPGMVKPTLTGTGFAVADAEVKESRNGNQYAKVRLRVLIEDKAEDADEYPAPWWITAMVFGRAADAAAEVLKGDACTFLGVLDRRHYTAKNGEEREHWTVLCDGFRAAEQPSGQGRGGGAETRKPARAKGCGRRRQNEPPPIDEDDIPF